MSNIKQINVLTNFKNNNIKFAPDSLTKSDSLESFTALLCCGWLQRIAKSAFFVLLGFILSFAAVGNLQATELSDSYLQPKVQFTARGKTENILSYNLAAQLVALRQPSQNANQSHHNLTPNIITVNLSVASTFTVTNTNDSGAGSLRQAIIDANSDPDVSSIIFNIDAAAPYTINLQSGLPFINTTMTIDATTQPGFDGAPVVELNGAGAGNANGFFVISNNNLIKGFVINRFNGHGILINGSNNTVAGNFIGTNRNGTSALPNSLYGIVLDGVSGNVIGGSGAGNLISGNQQTGVIIANNAVNNQVLGNKIGTNAAGTAAVPNGTGIEITNSSGNIISGNTTAGIALFINATNNRVIGNRVGTNAAGTVAVPNAHSGIAVDSSSGNIIGGTVPGARNVVSGNTFSGIAIYNNSANNRVLGNYSGTNADGTAAIPNGFEGISIDNTSGNFVGGTEPGAGNLFSGNASQGVLIQRNSANNQILGNRIGTNASGTAAIPNNSGGVIIVNSNGNIIGGTEPGKGNLISGNLNGGAGIFANSTGNIFQGNLIGTDATGTVALGNIGNGIGIDAGNNLIGGTSPAARNIISGNRDGTPVNGTGHGIVIGGSNASGNVVQGNYIGTNAGGNQKIANARRCVYLQRREQ